MGGAERAEKKRRQQQAAARAAAQRQSRGVRADPVKVALTLGVILAIAAVVVGFLFYRDSVKNATEGKEIGVETTQANTERRDGVVVVVGEDDAPATVDIYADFLCPACAQFEARWGDALLERANDGRLRMRVHMVPMLVELSDPPGYSLDAANAALCAADAGKFVPFHDSLFADQPEEGARGWDKRQLTTLGRDLGISGDGFADCVARGTSDDELESEFAETIERIPDFGTPKVIGPSGEVDLGREDWLDDLTRGG